MVVVPPVPHYQESEWKDIPTVVRRVEISITQRMTDGVGEKCEVPEANYTEGNNPDEERNTSRQPSYAKPGQEDHCRHRGVQEYEMLFTEANKCITVQVVSNHGSLVRPA